MEGLRAEALSERRRRILDGVAAGKSNGVLADELGISVDGVKWHVSELLGETGAADRRELGAWWRRTRAAAPAVLAPSWRSRTALAEGARFAFGVAFTALLALGVIAGWRCSGGAAPAATVAPASALGKIAYVLDGDIWTKTLPDGAPQNITHITPEERDGNDTYAKPSWSPSGEWLIAMKGKQGVVMRADGSDARFFDAPPPLWSPVADRIAYPFTADPGGQHPVTEIIAEDADGSHRTVLAPCAPPAGETCGFFDVTWRSDGTEIAYVEQHVRSGPPLTFTHEAIMSAKADDSAPSAVLYDAGSPPGDGLDIFSWDAPKTLLFYRRPSFTADLADGVVLLLLHPGQENALAFSVGGEIAPAASDATAPVVLAAPSLRSSERGDLAVVTDGAGRESWTRKRLAIVSRASGTANDITPADVAAVQPALFVRGDAAMLAYSAMPDAGTLAQARGPSEPPAQQPLAQRKLWVLRPGIARGADDWLHATSRQLTSDPAYRDEYPQWSADGTEILFPRLGAQDDHWSLWMMPASGGTPVQVLPQIDTAILGDAAPVWFGYYGTISWHDVLDWWHGG